MVLPAGEAAVPASPVQAALAADVQSVLPGRPFTLAVVLRLDPGWKVYWKHPGDTGLPTTVELTLPKGWKAGALRFPLPERFDSGMGMMANGYTSDVVLLQEVTPPADLAEGPHPILASVAWLACDSETCTPGEVQVGLNLARGNGAASSQAKALEGWRRRLPQPPTPGGALAPGPDGPLVSLRTVGTSYLLGVRWREAPDGVDVYPAPGENVMVETPRVKLDGAVCSVELTPQRIDEEEKASGRMPVLLVARHGKRRTGVEVILELPRIP